MRPPRQHLDPDRRAAAEVDQGLVVGLDRVLGDRLAQVAFEERPRPDLRVHAGLEAAEAVAPVELRPRQGDVGAVHEVAQTHAARVRLGDADAGADLDARAVAEEEGLREDRDDPRRDGVELLRGSRRTAALAEHERELVPAEPRDQVSFAHDAAQSGGGELEHGVAGGMSVGVVDGLEPVEVDQQDGMAVGGGLGQDDLGHLVEPLPVRQFSQDVGAGHRGDARLCVPEPRAAADRQGGRDQHHHRERQAQGFEPGAVADVVRAGFVERGELLAEDVHSRVVNVLEVAELRPVDQCARRCEIAGHGERERAPFHGDEIAMSLAHRAGERLAGLRGGEPRRLFDRRVELGDGLVVAIHPAVVARGGGHPRRHGHPLVEIGDGAAQLRDPDRMLGGRARFVPELLAGPAKPDDERHARQHRSEDEKPTEPGHAWLGLERRECGFERRHVPNVTSIVYEVVGEGSRISAMVNGSLRSARGRIVPRDRMRVAGVRFLPIAEPAPCAWLRLASNPDRASHSATLANLCAIVATGEA